MLMTLCVLFGIMMKLPVFSSAGSATREVAASAGLLSDQVTDLNTINMNELLNELINIATGISRGEIPEYQHNECYASGPFQRGLFFFLIG